MEIKDVSEFMAQEEDIIKDLCGALKERGFAADWFYNQLGEPTVQIHLIDEDGRKTKYFACFDTV